MSEPSCNPRAPGGVPVPLSRRAGVAGSLVVGRGSWRQGTARRRAGASGLAVPRFVSLKSDRVNLRQGPGTEYPTAWVFRRAGLPVEVIKEFESWRQVRDAEGTTGWVLGSMLSGRRTARDPPLGGEGRTDPAAVAALRDDDSESAAPSPRWKPACSPASSPATASWCRVSVGGFRGYIEQASCGAPTRTR